MRVGIVGPWHPADLVDALVVRQVSAALSSSLGASVALMTGRARHRFTWPIPAIDVGAAGVAGVDALLVVGDLSSGAIDGAMPADVWLPTIAMAQARGIPVVASGARLIDRGGSLSEDLARVLAGIGVTASPHPGGGPWHLIDHPLGALLEPLPVSDRAGIVVHASPDVLAQVGYGERDPEYYFAAIRPGRGDRLVGLPATARLLQSDQHDEMLGAIAGARTVITDDPAVAAIAQSQGTRVEDPLGRALAPGGRAEQERAWVQALERLRETPDPQMELLTSLARGCQERETAVESVGVTAIEPASQRDRDRLLAARRDAQAARERADRWRSDFYALKQRRAVRLALLLSALRARWRRGGVAGLARASARALSRGRIGTGKASPRDVPGSAADRRQIAQARSRINASLSGDTRTAGPLVSIVVLTRNGLEHLRRLLPGLDATTYRSIEVLIVDNGSGPETRDFLAAWKPGCGYRVLRNEHNATFGDGNDQAAAVARGQYLLLLNDDVEPMEPGWLGSLVSAAQSTGAGAVGTRLVYPDAGASDNAGDSVAPPLTLQHAGIHFENWGDGVPRPRHVGARQDATEARGRFEVPAATAACLLVLRQAFDQVGGFTAGYDYGLEDVDLCLKLRSAGWQIVIDADTALWHHEFGTQNVRGAADKQRRRDANRKHFADLWGPRLHRQVLLDRIHSARAWSSAPLHIAITVSRLDERRRHGDWYSAHELGGALEELGWRVSYVERYEDRWYDLARDVDVLIALIDALDLSRVPDHIVTVAWVRNWTHRWTERAWFDDFDIVFASSAVSADLIRQRSSHEPVLLPLATDPSRFSPSAATPEERCDVAFVGSYWGEDRPVAEVLAALGQEHDVRLYGRGWEAVPEVADLHRGVVAYERLPSVLASATIVLDDTATPTKPYEAVNTRVFDSIAAGTLVVSDNPGGIAEQFTTSLPTWDRPEEAVDIVRALLRDEAAREHLVTAARREALAQHTYAVRADLFRDTLCRWAEAPRIDVLAGVPDRRVEHRWGDTHFARAFQRQLRRRGVQTRLVRLPEWGDNATASADAVIHLFGLSTYEPREGQLSALWNISHPERVKPADCDLYDIVLVASDAFAAELAPQVRPPVHVVHQATDPERFQPGATGPVHDLLFVGNSRKVRRRIIDDLLPTDLELAVYGWGWTPDLLDPAFVLGDHVDNQELSGHYAAAAIVLNDHWDDMRRYGFASNRLYDALASGAFIISDQIDGLAELFDGGVVTYDDRDHLRRLVDHYLEHPSDRDEIVRRGRAAVLARHTFSHRAEQVLQLLQGQDARANVIGEPLVWSGLVSSQERNDARPHVQS